MGLSDTSIKRHQQLAAGLQKAGLVPPGIDPEPLHDALNRGGNLIPALLALWNDTGTGARSTAAAAVVQWLEAQRSQGGYLTLGSGMLPQQTEASWLGRRLAWWPAGIPAGRRVGLASSRIGRQLESQQAWFSLLRAACTKVDPQHDVLLTATDTTAAPYVQRAAELFGVRLLTVQAPQREDQPLANWVQRLCSAASAASAANRRRVVLSPALDAEPEDSADPELAAAAPARDRAVVALSDQLLVFHVRRRGQLLKLLQRRLADEAWPLGSLYVALGAQLVEPAIAAELMDKGAVGWVVTPTSHEGTEANEDTKSPAVAGHRTGPLAATEGLPPGSGKGSQSGEGSEPREDDADRDFLCQKGNRAATRGRRSETRIVSLPPAETWSFLTHCTRRQDRPWPDQSDGDYLADVILQRPAADHSAFAALWRIVEQRKLLASRQGIRGGATVVSFTAAALMELPKLRVFRPHRGRWDFESYGICVRRSWLELRGARAVQYGNDALWHSLPDADRPFFQVHGSSGDAARRDIIDWSVEQEWRHVGTLDLQQLPPRDGLVFVPTIEQARQLADVSRWPVTVLTQPGT